jgi:hypothetical protein
LDVSPHANQPTRPSSQPNQKSSKPRRCLFPLISPKKSVISTKGGALRRRSEETCICRAPSDEHWVSLLFASGVGPSFADIQKLVLLKGTASAVP